MTTTGDWVSIVVFLGGLIATAIVIARRWGQPIYRVLPFAYATMYAIVISLYQGKSASDLGLFVLGANIAAGVLFLALWFERPRNRSG